MKEKRMKPGQYYKTSDETADDRLQEQLHKIADAGQAIQHILDCMNAVRERDSTDDDEFSHLDFVEESVLRHGVALLGEFITDKSNKICVQFGLPEAL